MAVRTRSLVLLLFAITSGLVAAYLALGYLRRQAQPLLAASPGSGRAVIATRDLPVGTVLTDRDVRVVEWPGNAVPQGLVTNPGRLVDPTLATAAQACALGRGLFPGSDWLGQRIDTARQRIHTHARPT